MAQDRNLPEGTDKIIPGATKVEEVVVVEAVVAEPAGPRASGTGSSGGSSTGINQTTGQSGGTGGSSGGGGNGGSGKIMDKVRSGGEKLSGQAADKARDFVGQGLERSGDALSNVSRLVSDTASGIDERLGAEYGDYARRAAEAIDSTAQKLRSKNPDELIDDTRTFVRKSPGVALAGAAIVGFALARLVKTGLDASTNRSGAGDDMADQPTRGSGTSTGSQSGPGGGAA